MRLSILRHILLPLTLCTTAYACQVSDTPKTPDDDDGASSSSGGITTMCEEQCVAQHPGGEVTYRDLRTCLLCGACHDVCTEELGAATCTDGMDTGCSVNFADCATCINSTCALEQLADTTFAGACAAQGQACADTPGCVTLNNCVNTCVMGGTGGAGGNGTGGAAAGGAGGA